MSQFLLGVKDLVRKIPCLEGMRKYRHTKKFRSMMVSEVLAQKGMQNTELQGEIAQEALTRYTEHFPKRAKKLLASINDILVAQNIGDKEAKQLWDDMLFTFFAKGFSPAEYILYGFWNMPWSNRLAFMSELESILYGFSMNSMEGIILFSNKFESYKRLKPYYKRDAMFLSTPNDQEAFEDFVAKHTMFVKKVYDESCGRGVEFVDLSKNEKPIIDLLQELLESGPVVLEEVVQQTPDIARINPSSVNTVRVMTVRTKEGVVLPYGFFKAGRSGSFVDNGGSGGLFCGIDIETGVVTTDGVDEVGFRYSKHPDSQVEIIGFQLPEWHQARTLCIEMAEGIPEARWIGWDIAHTAQGWVVIEGNSLSEVIGPQSTSKSGVRKLLDELKNNS